MESRLAPCPFCGGCEIVNDDGVGAFGESITRYGARCKSCGVSFWHPDIGPANQPADTWFDWNTRPIEDAKDATIERMRGLLREAKSILVVMNHFAPAKGTAEIIARIEAELKEGE